MDLPGRHRPALSPSVTAPCDTSRPETHQEIPLRADPSAQVKLLELQELDARSDQLVHRRSHLPELADLVALETSRARLVDAVRDARIEVDDLTAEQEKIDADVEQVKARRERDRHRMDQGLVGNPKDLERIQHEVVSLERRIASLEDDELEVMGRVEEAQGRLDHLQQELDGTERRAAELTETRDRTWAEIDAETSDLAGTRAWTAEDLPGDLLALYDRLRAAKGGVGAAELRQRQCGGCRLGIDNAELSRIRALPPEEVVRCEECTRILVRTGESGL